MIRFELLDENLRDELSSRFVDREYAMLVLSSMLEVSRGEAEVAVCEYKGLLLFRIFDGEYLFPYPVEIDNGVEESDALRQISEYTLKEQIELTFTDVPNSEVEYLTSVFPKTTVYKVDDECSAVRVHTAFFEIPDDFSESFGTVTLSKLVPGDIPNYNRLNNDRNVNKYWGFECKNEALDEKNSFYFDEVKREESEKIALTLAVREGDVLIGEVQFFEFDHALGAEMSIRLFSEFWGRGIGKNIVLWAKDFLKKQGVISIKARVKVHNTASIGLFSSFMQTTREDEGVRFFEALL